MRNISKFLSEIFMLKRVKRSGFLLAGAEQADSLAEHIAVTSQIAFILGHLEGADPCRCAAICLFHDNHETRLGDKNKVSARYLSTKEAEKIADEEIFDNLPEELKGKILKLVEEKERRDTKEGVIAQDADWLEVALQAKIHLEQGRKGAQNWIDNVEAALETESAKKILAEIKNNPDFINSWWQGLKKMTHQKLK